MASTPCQKFLTISCQKAQNFVWFGSYDFVQITPACGPNTSQIMYGEKTFNVSINNGNIKCSIGKQIWHWNSSVLQLLMLTLEVWSLSIQSFMFVPYASEIWTKWYGSNYTKFWSFWQQTRFYNHFWQRFDAILEDVLLTIKSTSWFWSSNFNIFELVLSKTDTNVGLKRL